MPDTNIELSWGTLRVKVCLPERIKAWMFAPCHSEPLANPSENVLSALRNPAGPSLESLCKGVSRVCVIVSDRTRVTGIRFYLPVLVRFLMDCGLEEKGIEILVATGMHAPSGESGLSALLPAEVLDRFPLSEHDCRDSSTHFYAGRTTRGTEVYLNRKVSEAELVVLTGSIGFHYFAGYRGGRKSILPGISAFQTISSNHRLIILDDRGFHPLCKNASLEGNPVHEDMLEALRMIPPSFLLNTITDGHGNIVNLFTGEPVTAHLEGCKVFRKSAQVVVPKRADCVIVSCGGYPRDSTFIQAHKAMENVSPVLKEGGSMVAVAECRDGVGSETFLSWFKGESLSEVRRKLVSHYTLHGHTALSAMEKAGRFNMYLVSSLDQDIVRSMGIAHASSVEEALDDVLARSRGELATFVFPEGSETLPVLK